MSRTLNLIQRLLAKARKLQRLGVQQEALRLLHRLAGLRELPADVAEEVQRRQAFLQLRRRRYAKARRHLAAVLLYRPDSARHHYLMGRAIDRDSRADPRRAVAVYRRTLELAPDHPKYLSALGLAQLRAGQTGEGLASLRRAAELAADDPLVIGRVVKGLGRAHCFEEARVLLRDLMFRHPHDLRFEKMWTECRFQQLWHEQQNARRRNAAALVEEGPALLPFVRPAGESTAPRSGLRIIRRDGGTALPAPHLSRPTRRPRHAQ
jgi:tetratricopeptide (TPR) repeat protein